jgi:hypothetical protein
MMCLTGRAEAVPFRAVLRVQARARDLATDNERRQESYMRREATLEGQVGERGGGMGCRRQRSERKAWSCDEL